MGLGRVLGHAMMGYGKGQALAYQEEAEAKAAELENQRQIALENLRAENDSKARRETADYNDRNDARATERETNASIVKHKVEATTQEERDNRLHKQDLEVTRVTSQLRQSERAAELRLADQLDNAARAGEVQGVEIDGGTGEKVIVYKDGRTQRTGIMATEKELTHGSSSSGEPSALEQARGLGTAGTAPKPAPTPRPTTAPNKQQSSSKTYTMADAQATAKKHNVTIEEVHKRMREAGYKLAGS